jgi:hypothetical protein
MYTDEARVRLTPVYMLLFLQVHLPVPVAVDARHERLDLAFESI